jgi:hypothetical protein
MDPHGHIQKTCGSKAGMLGSLKALNGWTFLSYKAFWLPGIIASKHFGFLMKSLDSSAAKNSN